MGLLDRFRRRTSTSSDSSDARGSGGPDEQHLRQFVATRTGVEGYVEPRTTVSDVTLLLVAGDGEWTRRKVPSSDWAFKWAKKHQLPAYDAAVTGLPARMREYNRRQKQAEQERLRRYLDGPDTSDTPDTGRT